MIASVGKDVARVLAVLHDERAWFRHGLTDEQIAGLAGLPIERVIAAGRRARYAGLIERTRRDGAAVNMLTPLGVARARHRATPA